MAGSSSITSHAQWGAQPQPGDKDQMSACLQGAGKAATSTQPGRSCVTAGAGTDPPLSPQPWVPAARFCASPELHSSLPAPLLPPLACRWQETAENEDFTALASCQESLDGKKTLKDLLEMPGMPRGLEHLPSRQLTRALKQRLGETCRGCAELSPPETAWASSAQGQNSTGVGAPSGQRWPEVGTRLSPAPQTHIIGKKQPWLMGRAGTRHSWCHPHPEKDQSWAAGWGRPCLHPLSDLPTALRGGHLHPGIP